MPSLRRRALERLPRRLKPVARAAYGRAMLVMMAIESRQSRPGRALGVILGAFDRLKASRRMRPIVLGTKRALEGLRRYSHAVRRAPHRLMVRLAPERATSHLFDADFYRARYPDVAGSGLDPLTHYRTIGALEGRAPNALFDVATYRYDHPDVADYDGDVLLHYVAVGRDRGATPHPLFDPAWYGAQQPDIGSRDPYEHYLHVGAPEGRAASAAVAPGSDLMSAPIVLPSAPPDEARVTIVVSAFRHAALVRRCLAGIARHTPGDLGVRVLLADDDPAHPLAPLLADVEGLELVTNEQNLGFLRNCNAAAARATGDYIVFLNSDTVVLEGWLEACLDVALRDPHVGMVGARLLEPEGRLQEAGVVMFRDGWGYPFGRGDDPEAPAYTYVREVDAVTGACFMVRRVAWERLGGFDEAYAPAYFEEYELAFTMAAAGWKVLYQPAARVIHAGSASYGTAVRDRQTRLNHDRFTERWADELATRYEGPPDLFLARERPHRRGTVLVIDDKVPEYDRHAGALTIFQYLRLLVKEGFRVLYLPDDGQDREPYGEVLRQLGIEVLTGPFDAAAWFAEHGVHLDWVITARPYVTPRYLHHIRRRSRARVLYYPHDLHFLREQRRAEMTGDAGVLAESERLRAIETEIFRRVDCVLTPSEEEVPFIAELAPAAEIRVITPYFYRRGGTVPPADPPLEERRDVIFIGAYDHQPNVDAAIVLVREIMPLVWERVPDAHVALIGDFVPPEVAALAGERVSVPGHVPDLAPWWARARMSVSPLRYGAGVKGKIVASLEAGVPVVTTAVGNEGIALRPGVEALIGETPAELAAAIVRLYEEPETLTALARAGHAVIEGRFSEAHARDDLFTAMAVSG
jgi:GT2 family glycosyltransferase/glycosyltransferase involved in cell wall biosynthesis